MNLLGTLLNLFLRFGYAAVFLGVMLENVGIPLPGETILLAAGLFASQGQFRLWMVILFATVGAVLGDNAGYLLGRKVARPFLARRGRFLLLTPARLQAIEAFFQRHGDKTIFFARFISGLRVVAALFAGLSGMRWWAFAFYNAAGALVWATAMGCLGFFFGASWALLEKWVGRGGLFALGVAALAFLLHTLLRNAQVLRGSLTALPKILRRRQVVLLLANLTALALFSKLIEDVREGETTGFDRFLLMALHPHSGSPWNGLALVGSALGSAPLIILVVTVLGWVLLQRGARREAVALLAAAGIAEAVTLVLLYTVHRSHPSLWEVIVHLHRYSFPSGHALVATATYGMAAYLLGNLRPAPTRATYLGAGLLVLAIGASRVALGANWPTDVLGGFAGGLLILWAVIYWYEGDRAAVLRGAALSSGRGPAPAKVPGAVSQGDAGKPSNSS
jgi:membrane protein DedA with SNARE-associated domain/membrane-associated phospholipid phosphatase